MARLPQLVGAIEEADGRPLGSLLDFARTCREQGVIPPSPVGRGAVVMTCAEAVDLLVATALPVPTKRLAPAVATFRGLPRRGESKTFRIGRTRTYLALPDTAGECLELLIERAPSLPDNLRIMFRFSAPRLALVIGIGRVLAVEYTARRDIGLLGGGDRVIETAAHFSATTLLRVHHALQ